MSKVSAQFIGFKPAPTIDAAAQAFVRAKAFAIKVVNELARAQYFAANLPEKSLIVYRDQAFQQELAKNFDWRLLHDIDGLIRDWLNHHLPIADANPRFVIEIMNEWSGGWHWNGSAWMLDIALIKAYAHFEAMIAQAMFAHGHKVVMGNWAVAHPPYEAAQYLSEMLEAANRYGMYVGFHCYNSPYFNSSLGGAGRPEDFVFRYDTWWKAANGYALYPNALLLVTEFNKDEINDNHMAGWRRVPGATAQSTANEIYNYVSPIFDSHPRLIAVFWYRFGHDLDNADADPEFQFDAMDYAQPPRADQDLARFIIEHVNAAGSIVIPPYVPPPSPPPVPPVPTPVGPRQTSTRGTVYIRRTPVYLADGSNVVTTLAQGAKVWVGEASGTYLKAYLDSVIAIGWISKDFVA